MSILITISTYDGIIIASDSRITYTDEKGNYEWCEDNSQKIFLMNHKVCIGFTNDTTKDGQDLRAGIRNYIKINKDKNKYVEDTIIDFEKEFNLDRYKSPYKNFDSHIYVVGYDEFNMPMRMIIKTASNPTEIDTIAGYFFTIQHLGNENEMLQDYIDKICIKYSKREIAKLGVDKAMNLCYEIIVNASKLENTIGGPIDIILMNKGKTRWIKDKRNRHELLSQKTSLRFMPWTK